MVVWIWIVIQRPLRRAFFGPCLQGGQFFEGRQVIAAAGGNKLLNRSRLRQVDEQALRGLLVLGEVPRGPEERQERCEASLRSVWERMGPALFGYFRRVALVDRPGTWRTHDHRALARN